MLGTRQIQLLHVSAHCPAERTIKQLGHKMATKALTISLDTPTRLLQLIITILLDVRKVWWRGPSSGLVKMFTEISIKCASFELEDEVVEDDT
jgi:hypothetical protein